MTQCFKILTITFCLGFSCQVNSIQPRLSKSYLSSQLEQPSVSAIHRDSKGILWIGTQKGLHRFDGANLTIFNSDRNNSNWIPDSEIRDIDEHIDGSLLVVTSSGVLLKLNLGSDAFDPITEFGSIDDTKLSRLLASTDGGIWLISKDGLILYEPKFDHTEDWVKKLKLLDVIGRPNDLLEDTFGTIWVGGNRGIAKIQPKKQSIDALNLEMLGLPNNSKVTAIKMNSEGNLIIGTSTGHLVLWEIESGTSLAQTELRGNIPNYISKLLLYEDLIIIGTDRGLYASDNKFSFIDNLGDKADEISNPDIYSLFREGNYVWVGAIDGLGLLSFAPFELFNSKNSGVSKDVLSFEEDNKGRIWLGTYSGAYFYDETTKAHSKFEVNSNLSPLRDQKIVSILARNSELWLGFLHGGVQVVNSVNGDSWTPNLSSTNEIAITKILSGEQSQDVWIATYSHGLFRVTDRETFSYYETQTLPEKSITVLFLSTTGIFLAISGNKVYLYDPKTDRFDQQHFDFGLGGDLPFIYSFGQAKNDDILIGTKDHGLFIWSRKSQLTNQFHLQSPESGSGIETSTIYGIEPDSEDNLWCSTQNGIVKLDSKGQLIKRFTMADGLQGKDFNFGAAFTSRDGLIYFGGVNGYNRFDPTEVVIDSSASPMRLTGITFPSQENSNPGVVADLKSLQLTHKDHFITFQFSVLDFIHPEGNQYRYKLDNFDPDWIDNGNRNTATYTNLPAGEYVLRVQGANSSGIWNRDGITLNVRVLPAPWFTWWAYCTYGVAAMILWWGSTRIYHSYASERQSTQMKKDMFEAENKADDDMQEQLELQDELIHSAYQHNLTTLALVGDCISIQRGNEPDVVVRGLNNGNAKRISALSILEDCLYYQAGGLVANLQKYTDAVLSILLRKSPLSPETIITINEIPSRLLPAKLASPLSIVIYELLENCVQHAFEKESPANYIHITMAPEPADKPLARYLKLSVRDSGIGIPHCMEDLATENSGIAIAQSIVNKLGGTLQFSGTSGTTISLTVPDPGTS
jgi:ligand-binding sensor domain-containing protein/two-component sensor histidine kinase